MPATAATQVIFFIVAIILAVSVAMVAIDSIQSMTYSIGSSGKALSKKLGTDIKIINDPLNMKHEPFSIYVQNVGSETLNPRDVTVLIDGEKMDSRLRLDSYDITKEVISNTTTKWIPSSVLEIRAPYARLEPGVHIITVITENGVMDSLAIRI